MAPETRARRRCYPPRVAGARRRAIACALGTPLGTFLGLLAACAPAARPELPSILIVTLDTTRADHLGAYGYPRDTSPVLDALAAESLLFEKAIAPIATTLPSHVSVFTATAPNEHGVLANQTQGGRRFVAAPRLRPIAEIASELGYQTAAFVSAAPLKRDSGVEAGFAHFDEPPGMHRAGRETIDAAIAWLEATSARRFFLWVHLYDAHWPYDAPPPFDRLFSTDAALERRLAERRIPDRALRPLTGTVDDARASINAYDGELRYQDAELGRLLAFLRESGRWQDTAVLLLGDHGEGLCQHGEPAHGGTWAEQLHVPLLMRVPGVAARRVARPLSLVDAMPTFLALLGVPQLALPEAQASGRDVLGEGAADAPILSQDTGRRREQPYRIALTAGRWKYFRIEGSDGRIRDELYDLDSDPFELEDLAARHPERAAELRRGTEARWSEQIARGERLRGSHAPATQPLDPRIKEQLEALGYASDAAARPPSP